MTRPPQILLLIPHLGGGGAEQVTTLLANGLSHEKYELHLGLMTEQESGSFSALPWIAVHALGAARVRAAAFPLLRLVWSLKPALILSGMAHLNFLVLLLRPILPSGTAVLVRQNATVSAVLASGAVPSYTRLLYRRLYRHADRIICQTRAMADDLRRELALAGDCVAVLPNPVNVDQIQCALSEPPSEWTGPGPHLLAVGRLSQEKGFDLLLRAFAAARERFPCADLTIVGGGLEDAPLKAQCRTLGLEDAVHFTGPIACPYAYFPGATLFVLSSRHEGLPNALLEAAAGGLPLVALPSSGGVVNLIQGQPGVWIATEVSAEALAATLLDALLALRPGERFAHTFVEQFRFDRAIAAYERLIDATLERSQP
jgi:glycosyltransferase involved in cell wall biosynthesis